MPASAKRILIAPLDWGLGHTARCIPVIRALQQLGHVIIFAGTEQQTAFIRRNGFPEIDVRKLEGYRVRYSRRGLMFTLAWQIPRLLRVIRWEHSWLLKLVAEEQIDGIISDNRYGLWHPAKPSAIITHQPRLRTGIGGQADSIVRAIHSSYLNRFSSIWIPDLPGPDNLGGSLSHPAALKAASRFIGWLSQFRKPLNAPAAHILILLSGPEPQRSMLADALWSQTQRIQRPFVFVEGAAAARRTDIPPHIRHFGLADAATLQPLLESASLVVCRSGYSTLMDLMLMKKPAVLIPTPGQAEQEYLAGHLAERGVFHAATQQSFNLKAAIETAESGSRIPGNLLSENDPDLLLPALQDWLNTL